MKFQRQLEDYISYFEHLNARSIRLVEKMAAPEIRFIDPFHDVRGVEVLEQILKNLFDRRIDRIKIKVTNTAWGRDGYTAFLRWDLSFVPKGKNEEWQIEGMSEIIFGPDGKIVQHHNHWDSGSQVIAHLPILKWGWGWFLRRVLR